MRSDNTLSGFPRTTLFLESDGNGTCMFNEALTADIDCFVYLFRGIYKTYIIKPGKSCTLQMILPN